MELVKVKSNQSLVVEQIDRAIQIADFKADNELAKTIRDVSKAFLEGMLTTIEFVNKIDDLKSTYPSELQEMREADITLLALCNARHMLSQ